MAYATFADLVGQFGWQRLLSSTPGQTESTIEAYWGGKLLAASGKIDSALRKQNYVFPLVFPDPDDGTLAQLREICIALALELGQSALISTPEGVKSAADLARDDLRAVALGRWRLPLPIGQSLFASTEPVQRTPSEPRVPLDERVFDALERVGGP